MSLLKKEHEGILIVVFTDSKVLDAAQIDHIGTELVNAANAAKGGGGKLLLNFSGVTFMSSAMIGKLVYLKKKCEADGTAFKLCCVSDNLMEVFKITKLHKVFDIQKSEDKAIQSFNKKGWFG